MTAPSAMRTAAEAAPGPLLAGCCVAIMVALLVVGAVSHGVIRHVVQTAPLWIAIVLGTQRSDLGKWAALPSFLFWLLLMIAIWLFLLGWARIVSGTFTVTEIAMTIVVGVASTVGIVAGLRMRTATRTAVAAATVLGVTLLDLIAFWVSLLPAIAHR
jgi:hypothetical protein